MNEQGNFPQDEPQNVPKQQSAEELLKAAAHNVSELASLATHQLEDTVSRGKTKLKEMQTMLSDKSRDYAQTTDQYVHDRTWSAIGFAAGLGFIVGLLIRRR